MYLVRNFVEIMIYCQRLQCRAVKSYITNISLVTTMIMNSSTNNMSIESVSVSVGKFKEHEEELLNRSMEKDLKVTQYDQIRHS
jgi:hypothetical protein